MSESDPFQALAVDADDYAEAAASDQAVPSKEAREARTFQSEADFQREKAAYTAKFDTGNLWHRLATFDPPFPRAVAATAATRTHEGDLDTPTATATASASASASATTPPPEETREPPTEQAKPKLDRKQFQLVSAAAGELYLAREYDVVLEMCSWLEGGYASDPKMGDAVRKWRERCEARGQGRVFGS